MRIIIADDGRIWDASSRQLRRHFHVSGSDEYVERTIVRLVGCISVQFLPRVAIVTLRPGLTSKIALGQLFYTLFDHAPRAIAIQSSCDKAQLFQNVPAAVSYLGNIVNSASRSGTVQYEEKDLCVDLLSEQSSFGMLLRFCQERSMMFDLEAFNKILSEGLAGRYIVAETGDSDGELRIKACGDGFIVPTPAQCRQLPGSPLTCLPDTNYAKRVATSYMRAQQVGRPLFQVVKSFVNWGKIGMVESEYVRLLVPLRLTNNNSAFLSVSRSIRREHVNSAVDKQFA